LIEAVSKDGLFFYAPRPRGPRHPSTVAYAVTGILSG
jgi:hypothetical protein